MKFQIGRRTNSPLIFSERHDDHFTKRTQQVVQQQLVFCVRQKEVDQKVHQEKQTSEEERESKKGVKEEIGLRQGYFA